MSKLEKSFVVEQVNRVVHWQREYRWLADLGVVAPIVAHFRSGSGESTLGLMWAVDGKEGVALDSDEDLLQIGRDRLEQLKWEMEAIWKRLRTSDSLPTAEFMWWNDEVPDFLKHNLLDEGFGLDFRIGSLPYDNPLEREAYDLVFCDMVLNEIWWDRTRVDADEETRVAIGQMARLLRPGGYLAAFEWVEQRFRPRLDFRLLFEQLRLEVRHAEEVRLDNWRGRGQAAGFLCQKVVY
ncbi:MAG TPA: class I SAM-dependent methyltransferase [Anaerolineales bacterium]|nr:class I SAM-dependent methyltransferase [Anaerolineales bacterium]